MGAQAASGAGARSGSKRTNTIPHTTKTPKIASTNNAHTRQTSQPQSHNQRNAPNTTKHYHLGPHKSNIIPNTSHTRTHALLLGLLLSAWHTVGSHSGARSHACRHLEPQLVKRRLVGGKEGLAREVHRAQRGNVPQKTFAEHFHRQSLTGRERKRGESPS